MGGGGHSPLGLGFKLQGGFQPSPIGRNLANDLGVVFSSFQLEIGFNNLYFNNQVYYGTVNCLFILNKFVFISSSRKIFYRCIIDIVLVSGIQCNGLILTYIIK